MQQKKDPNKRTNVGQPIIWTTTDKRTILYTFYWALEWTSSPNGGAVEGDDQKEVKGKINGDVTLKQRW